MNKWIIIAIILLVLGSGGGLLFFLNQKKSHLNTTTLTNSKTYTLTDIATHNSATSCWAAVNGNVYDLTNWINQHPGGRDNILGICGTDATAAFQAQHGNAGEPQEKLDSFIIGKLK